MLDLKSVAAEKRVNPKKKHASILYMEDNNEIANYVKTKIEELGYEIDIAGDGEIGLEMFEEGNYDLVLIDNILPKVEGLDIIRYLKEIGTLTPIIMLTGQGDESTAVEAFKLGVSDYVVKSESFMKLLPSVIERALHTKSEEEKRVDAEKALIESENKLRRLFESSFDSIMLFDDDGMFDCNTSTIRMFDLSKKADFFGKGLADISATVQFGEELARDVVARKIETLLANGRDQFEWVFCKLNGEEFTSEVLLTTFKLGSRNIIQATVRDITNRKRIEQSLMESEQKARESLHFITNIINTVADPIFIKDEQHRWIMFNEAFCKFLGYSREEIEYKSDYDLFPKEQADVFWEKDNLVFSTEEENVNEEKLTDAQGKEHYLSTKKRVFSDPSTGKKVLVGVIREISDFKKTESLLREDKKRFEDLANLLPQIVFELDATGKFTFCNHKGFENSGYTAEDLNKGVYSRDLLGTSVPGENGESLLNLFKEEKVREIEHIIRRKDGSTFPALIYSSPIKDGEKIVGYRGIAFDITERKIAEEKIRKSETQLRQVIDLVPHAIFSRDINGIFLLANQKVAELYGTDLEHLIGSCAGDLAKIKTEMDLNLREDREVIETGKKKYIPEREITDSQDNKRFMEITKIPFKQGDGESKAVLGVAVDITDRKRAEEEIKKLKVSVDQAYDSIMITGANKKLIYVNPAFENMTGYKQEEVLGQDPGFLIGGHRNKTFYKKLNVVLKKDKIWQSRVVNKKKNGKLYTIDIVISPVKNDEGKIINLIGMARDISEKIRLEKKINSLRRENEQFMRHEIANNISPIYGYSDLLLELSHENMTDEQISYCQMIKTKIHKIKELVDRLKNLHEIEMGNYDLKKSPYDLRLLIKEVIEESRLQADDNGVVLKVIHACENSNVMIDRYLMHGVFLNLVKNAIEHVANLSGKREKTIKVRLSNEDKNIVVTVNNKGNPISEEVQEVFFEKFNTNRLEKKGGTGLGTSYAQIVVLAHGGEISVASDKKNGTTLTVKLKFI